MLLLFGGGRVMLFRMHNVVMNYVRLCIWHGNKRNGIVSRGMFRWIHIESRGKEKLVREERLT